MDVENELRAMGISCNSAVFNENGVGLAVVQFDKPEGLLDAVRRCKEDVIACEYADITPLTFMGQGTRPRKVWHVLLKYGMVLRHVQQF